MPKHLCLLCCAAALWLSVAHAQKYTLSGYITDAASGEPLIAANVLETRLGVGAVSNTYGFYSLTLNAGDSLRLMFSYIGYQPFDTLLLLRANLSLNVALQPFVELTTVEVRAERGERIEQQTQMGRMEAPVEQIKRMPALLGEVDVLKALQFLPGVQSGGEGQNGLYVRGGSPDQNLVLLDGVPVYNVSHLLGIFSVFNADAIKNVTLTKGGFPARYGGRLSSVLEINMKEGNTKTFKGEGSVGLISSRLTLEGPIVKDKTSFLISARRTYADLIFRPLIQLAQSANPDEKFDPRLYFYDLNAKLQHRINDRHRLYLSAYTGADVFKIKYRSNSDGATAGTDWGNLISALRWNWQLSPRLFANTTLTYSRYNIDIVSEQESRFGGQTDKFSAKYISGIEDLGGKVDFDYLPSAGHHIRFGGGATNHTYSPGALALKGQVGAVIEFDTLLGSRRAFSTEYFLYAEDDFALGLLRLNAGLHASAFDVQGKLYTSLQPRLGLRYLLSNQIALKAGFSTMTQFINLLTNESLSLPTDLWVPSTRRIVPQQAWQASLGAAHTFRDQLEISVEGYYKQMRHVLSYKEGASFLFGFDSDWQDQVTQGNGESYGLEFFAQKKLGRTTGWLGYTLSWNWRQFDDINGGLRYPFRYDRRHDVALVVNHDFSKRFGLSVAWVYGTGNAVTLNTFKYPVEVFSNGANPDFAWTDYVESGGQRNAFRMAPYHRLDFSLEFRKQKNPRWERKWVLGAYNTYNRRNPYFLLPGTKTVNNEEIPVIRQISILPLIPHVSYQFKFF